MYLHEALDIYMAVRNPGGKPHTARLHSLAIARLRETLGHEPAIEDLTDENIGRHAQRRLADGVARDTVAGEQAKLLAQWRFYHRRGLTQLWPESRPITGVQRSPQAWTQEEFNKLYNACDIAPPMYLTPGPVWWRCFLECLFYTGERFGAMVRIEWTGIQLEAMWLTLPAEVRKGGQIDRRYRIPGSTVELLDKMPKDRIGPFDVPYCKSTIYNRYKKILKAAGLPTDRRSKFHRIRRTTASHYAAAGGNAQELLGHSSPKVTKLYIDPAIVQQPQAVDLLFSPKSET